jgi:hypothetical protein
MWSRLRQEWIWAAAVAVGLLAFTYRTLSGRDAFSGDYNLEARPAMDALVGGHIADFLRQSPAYGGSLLLRAPFVLAARAFGAGEHWMYRASVIPVLLACGILAWWLATRMGRANAHWLAPLVVVGVCVLNPVAMQAVIIGHPEELLGAVLCVAAVLCATRGRPIWAGVLLGLAIANKEWALVAVGPVLVALPRKRLLCLTWAAAVAGAIITPFVIAGAVDLNHGLQGLPAANTGKIFTPWQVWWFFGPGDVMKTLWGWLAGLAHPLIVGISLALALVYVHRLRRRGSAAPDGLLLLAFVLLLRCMLDPWDTSYYPGPFLIALVTWEALRFRRLPLLTVAASFFAWFLYFRIPDSSLHFTVDRTALLFLVVTLSGAVVMAFSLYVPGVGEWLGRRVPHRTNVEPPLEPS